MYEVDKYNSYLGFAIDKLANRRDLDCSASNVTLYTDGTALCSIERTYDEVYRINIISVLELLIPELLFRVANKSEYIGYNDLEDEIVFVSTLCEFLRKRMK